MKSYEQCLPRLVALFIDLNRSLALALVIPIFAPTASRGKYPQTI